MKRLFLVTAITAILTSCSQPRPDAVDNPEVLYSSAANRLDVTRVEMTDSSTTLHFNATFRPGWWIRISDGSFIVAEGDTLPIVSADGIIPGKKHTMPESGKDTFSLTFGSISPSATSLTFSEGADGWTIAGIDLTGRGLKLPALPASVRRAAKGNMSADPVMEVGKSTFHLTILGYDTIMGREFPVTISACGGNPQEIPVAIGMDGTATVTATLYGTSRLSMQFPNADTHTPPLIVAPGEEVEIFIDPRFTNSASRSRLGLADAGPYVHDNGSYAPLNAAILTPSDRSLRISSGIPELADAWSLSAPQYADRIIDIHSRYSASIDSLDADQAYKLYLHRQLDCDALGAITGARYLLGNTFYAAHPGFDGSATDSVAIMTDTELARIAALVNPSDRGLRIAEDADVAIAGARTDWTKYDGCEGASEFVKFDYLLAKAQNSILSDTEREDLAGLETAYYIEAVNDAAQKTARRLQELEKLITPTPAVADADLFDAIVSPHRGKVVLVDLWDTWCRPCREAIRIIEPLKSNRLATDDIVWIYIADDSSDPVKYARMLPDIKGIHYRVNQEQIKAIRKQFKVDGIPFYILVDRDGKASGRPDFRDHELLTETLLNAI